MQDVLQNTAHILLMNFCKENGINTNGVDQQGSTVAKNGRGFKYSLVNISDGYAYITVTLSKNSVPHFTLSDEAKQQRAHKVDRLRNNMPGYVLGDLTPFASDADVLEVCDLNDKKAAIHNRAFSAKKYRG